MGLQIGKAYTFAEANTKHCASVQDRFPQQVGSDILRQVLLPMLPTPDFPKRPDGAILSSSSLEFYSGSALLLLNLTHACCFQVDLTAPTLLTSLVITAFYPVASTTTSAATSLPSSPSWTLSMVTTATNQLPPPPMRVYHRCKATYPSHSKSNLPISLTPYAPPEI